MASTVDVCTNGSHACARGGGDRRMNEPGSRARVFLGALGGNAKTRLVQERVLIKPGEEYPRTEYAYVAYV